MAQARHRTVAVRVERLLDEPGLWCARCALPSVIRTWVSVSYAGRMHLQSWLRFEDCGVLRHEPPA